MTETIHSEADAKDIVARQLHRLLCLGEWATCNTKGIHWHDADVILAALSDAGYRLLPPGTESRMEYARVLEARGSVLCDDDCDDPEYFPTGPAGERIDHHCECRAVLTAAQLLGGQRFTVHADQCSRSLHEDLDRIHAEYTP